jgi:hypothetical protein
MRRCNVRALGCSARCRPAWPPRRLSRIARGGYAWRRSRLSRIMCRRNVRGLGCSARCRLGWPPGRLRRVAFRRGGWPRSRVSCIVGGRDVLPSSWLSLPALSRSARRRHTEPRDGIRRLVSGRDCGGLLPFPDQKGLSARSVGASVQHSWASHATAVSRAACASPEALPRRCVIGVLSPWQRYPHPPLEPQIVGHPGDRFPVAGSLDAIGR